MKAGVEDHVPAGMRVADAGEGGADGRRVGARLGAAGPPREERAHHERGGPDLHVSTSPYTSWPSRQTEKAFLKASICCWVAAWVCCVWASAWAWAWRCAPLPGPAGHHTGGGADGGTSPASSEAISPIRAPAAAFPRRLRRARSSPPTSPPRRWLGPELAAPWPGPRMLEGIYPRLLDRPGVALPLVLGLRARVLAAVGEDVHAEGRGQRLLLGNHGTEGDHCQKGCDHHALDLHAHSPAVLGVQAPNTVTATSRRATATVIQPVFSSMRKLKARLFSYPEHDLPRIPLQVDDRRGPALPAGLGAQLLRLEVHSMNCGTSKSQAEPFSQSPSE